MKNITKGFFFVSVLLSTFVVIQAQPRGSAIQFDGWNDRVLVPHHASLNMTSGFTIAAWVKLDSYVEWASIVTKGVGDNNYTIHQSGPDGASDYGHLRFTGTSPALPLFLESNTKIPLHEWHYVAITYDGTHLTFYYDGRPDGGGVLPGPLGTNSQPLLIGADFPGAPEFWDGSLDEIRIWNVSLNAKHIKAAMNGHAAPRANALVGYWRFDEGKGMIAHDRSKLNNHGYLLFGPTWISPGAPIGNSSRLGRTEVLSVESYPNPFKEQTTIRFETLKAARVQLMVFNSLGQTVKILNDINLDSGIHEISWDARDESGQYLSTGVYYFQLTIGEEKIDMKKMVLIN